MSLFVPSLDMNVIAARETFARAPSLDDDSSTRAR